MVNYIPWNSQPLDEWSQKHAPGKFIDLNGRSTHYIEKGAGEPLILIHGFNMDLATWHYNIDALASLYKVYAIDLWGLGYSTRQPLDHGFDLFVEQVGLFMDVMEIKKATLMGHSMGGGIAITFAVRHRQRVDKLVLVDSVGLPFKMALRAKLFKMPGVAEFLMGMNNDYLRKKNLKELWLHDGEYLTEERFTTVSQFQKIQGSTEILLAILRKDFFQELSPEIDRLGQMDVPALIVWGRHDAAVPFHVGEEIHRRLEGSTFVVIEDGAHMPNFELPDEFNQIVTGFLSPVGETAASATQAG